MGDSDVQGNSANDLFKRSTLDVHGFAASEIRRDRIVSVPNTYYRPASGGGTSGQYQPDSTSAAAGKLLRLLENYCGRCNCFSTLWTTELKLWEIMMMLISE